MHQTLIENPLRDKRSLADESALQYPTQITASDRRRLPLSNELDRRLLMLPTFLEPRDDRFSGNIATTSIKTTLVNNLMIQPGHNSRGNYCQGKSYERSRDLASELREVFHNEVIILHNRNDESRAIFLGTVRSDR